MELLTLEGTCLVGEPQVPASKCSLRNSARDGYTSHPDFLNSSRCDVWQHVRPELLGNMSLGLKQPSKWMANRHKSQDGPNCTQEATIQVIGIQADIVCMHGVLIFIELDRFTSKPCYPARLQSIRTQPVEIAMWKYPLNSKFEKRGRLPGMCCRKNAAQ